MKKKILFILLCLTLVFAVAGCGEESSNKDKSSDKEEEKSVLSNDIIKIDGIYVDDSSADEDGLKTVVVFYTLSAKDENLELSSKSFNLIINGKNEYMGFIDSESPNLTDYYYSEFIEDIYVGNELKMASTYKVPDGDLTAGKTVEIEEFSGDLTKGLKITTNDIKHMENMEKICEDVDKETYDKLKAEEEQKMQAADSATKKKVTKEVNGYVWTFNTYVGQTYIRYELAFVSKTKFEVESSVGLSNSGTYEITNGYILLHYDTGITVKSEWAFEDGELTLTCPFANNGKDKLF